MELTLSTPWISMLSVKEAIIFLRYWCLKLSMGLRHAPSDRIVMNFDANGYDTRGSEMDLYLITLCKEEIMFYIYIYIYGWQSVEWTTWICTKFYEYWNIYTFTKCTTLSSAHDRIDIFIFFGNFGNVMIISWLLENSTLYIDMDFCISLGTV